LHRYKPPQKIKLSNVRGVLLSVALRLYFCVVLLNIVFFVLQGICKATYCCGTSENWC